ncbi:hypothetical protein J7E70_00435 [Variovorax paradoxus]|nr:hypothetical protein [Variovorax paradoxus]MBT2298918.1 hypothetical protein [Variovorax paradoxus]
MSRALFALVLLLLACSAQAQRQPPSSTEIRSAYCISVLTGRARDAQMLASLPAPRSLQEGFREVQAGYEQDVRRLRSYLVPRMKHLDGEALLEAADRGQSDVNSFLRTQLACKTRCDTKLAPGPDASAKNTACLSACSAEDPAFDRVNACSAVNWL